MMEFEPPLVGCVISGRNYSFDALRATKECVLNIPALNLAKQVVGVGNCSGEKVDKFEKFKLTPLSAARNNWKNQHPASTIAFRPTATTAQGYSITFCGQQTLQRELLRGRHMTFWKASCWLAALLWVCCGAAWAEDAPKPANDCAAERGRHILWENDMFTGKLFGRSDKWYTNGIKVYSSYKENCVPGYLPNFLEDRINGLSDGNRYAVQTGNVVGQLMFTPKNLTISTPQPMDRFWGGWLYAGIVAQRQPYDTQKLGKELNKEEFETLELDIGMTGPISGAEQVQRGIHAISNSTMPYGWSNQIKAEPGVQLNYARVSRIWKRLEKGDKTPHIDLSWHYGGALGTLFDYVNGGFTVRIGSKLTDAAPNVIESPSIGQFRKINNGGYFLARLDVKGVVHNTFIDGSLLREDPYASYLSSKHIVPQLTFGGVLELKHDDKENPEGARLSLLIHRRGSEFGSPAGPGAIFNFATLNVEWDL